tara:strand:- start:2685 stop:3482 length:798 start_codon:yes stop_codon:yes gene_type:complete
LDLIWNHWHGHPDVIIGLGLIESIYLVGVGPLRKRYNLSSTVQQLQVLSFTLGILVIFLSLLSPLHVLADKYLFSAHMLQHVLLTLVAPPLIVLGIPHWLIRPLLRPRLIFLIASVFTHPLVAFILFNATFSIWHIPGLYNLSVTNHGIHIFEHLLFMGTATCMWWPIFSTLDELPRLSYPLKMGYLFLLSLAQLIIFGPIAFSPDPIYQWYSDAPRVWDFISVMTDQQLGAIIMKVGGALIFISLIINTFFKWYSSEEKKHQLS